LDTPAGEGHGDNVAISVLGVVGVRRGRRRRLGRFDIIVANISGLTLERLAADLAQSHEAWCPDGGSFLEDAVGAAARSGR
jgi:hypothetical protein